MFVSRAVGWDAAGAEEGGVGQVVDVGCGFPPSSRTHEIAATVHRSPSVVYIDWDPEVLDNLEALRGRGGGARFAVVPVISAIPPPCSAPSRRPARAT